VKTLLIVGIVAVALLVVGFFVIANALSGGGEKTDCDTFTIRAGDWQAADFDRRRALVKGMQDCGTLEGKSTAEVTALLGPPSEQTADALTYPMPYESDQQFLRVVLDDGRVKRLFVEAPSGPPRP
jgi:hypothetical protein